MLPEGEAAIWRRFFDFWRQNYDDLPYVTHQSFYNMVAETFPHQDKANRKLVEDALTYALSLTGHPLRVWELGGWDGALAKDMIASCGDGISAWHNYEICSRAVETGWIDDTGRYKSMEPYGYPAPGSYDIAILSHVIEHLSFEDLKCMLLWYLIYVPLIYIQTPPSLGRAPHPTGWYGTMSTHILEVGMDEVEKALESNNYGLIWRRENAVFYGRLHETS